jgi:glycosyltransferase involved in cell wall biosynthesis
MSIWYIYPVFKHVSFTAIAERHIKELKKKFWVETLDESAIPFFSFSTRPTVLLHPYFYPLQKYEKVIQRFCLHVDGLIGVDVADSNRISDYAVRLTNYADALIVPSNFSKNAYINSGVKKPVHVIPHGVDDDWLNIAKQDASLIPNLELAKRRGYKLLLSFMMHSEYRKGYDLLDKIYTRVRKERSNVRLLIKAVDGLWLADKNTEDRLIVSSKGWFSENELMTIFDNCDLYLLTSRGGGFEHPPLQGLARGLPMIGAKGGSWEDYMPSWAGVDSKPSGVVLEGNPIHTGTGVEIDVGKAVDKVLYMLDNLDDFKAKTGEYANTVIRENFTWSKIGEKLIKLVRDVEINASLRITLQQSKRP